MRPFILSETTWKSVLESKSPIRLVAPKGLPWVETWHLDLSPIWHAAFEGIHHTIEDVFATDDRVAVRFILNGRHTGSFFGIPASGKEVTIVANVLMHATEGKVSALFGIFDEAGLLRQIGAPPA